MLLTDLSYTAQGSTLASYHWSYDADSQVTDAYSYSDTSDVSDRTSSYSTWADTNYTYDNDGELTGTSYTNFASPPTSNTSQTYDTNGNRTSTNGVSASSSSNRLLTDGVYNYTYDADGNCIARTNISDGTVTSYEWNNAGELTAVLQYPSWSDYIAGSGSTSETDYAYNAAGQMVTMSPNSGPSQHYVYDGQNLALVLNSSGQVVERDLYGPAVNQILATETVTPSSAPQAAGTVNWLLTDNQGTVRDVAQYNSGTSTTTVVDHLVFDSSGQLTSQSNSAYQPRITYQGMWLDPASDLYYDKARWYNAVDSVFMSPDPLGFAGGQTNLSEFVRNSPTNYTDPSGLQAVGGMFGAPASSANNGSRGAVGLVWNPSGGGDIPVFGSGYKALAISDVLGGQSGHLGAGLSWTYTFTGVPGMITGIPPSFQAQADQLVANAIALAAGPPPPQPITSIQLDPPSAAFLATLSAAPIPPGATPVTQKTPYAYPPGPPTMILSGSAAGEGMSGGTLQSGSTLVTQPDTPAPSPIHTPDFLQGPNTR